MSQHQRNAFVRSGVLVAGLFALSACNPSGDSDVSEPIGDVPVQTSAESASRFNAEIRWTSYGIPHVKADDWASLGYGFAYATAKDAVCTIATDVVMVNGEMSRYFGPDGINRSSDIFHRAVLDSTMLSGFRAGQTEQSNNFSDGYVAGYNRYLRDHMDALPAACAGAEWVRPLSNDDLDRLTVGVGIRYGLGRYQREMANAAPPGQEVANSARIESIDTDFEIPAGIGSNAVAMGSAVTETGSGLLLGNPHYPWQGSSRFHMIHTTIPGEVDVMGVSLYTTSRVGIGFNHDVAWTHTVSTGLRSTFYALQLNPENPTQYLYGDTYRDMTRVDIELPVRGTDGAVTNETSAVYMTHYGPVVVSNQLPWTSTQAFAIRDVNLYNDRSAATYDALSKATSIDEVEAALSLQGVAWVNTIAADRHGTAFYADISTVPNVDSTLFEQCRLTPEGGPTGYTLPIGVSAQLVVLNGADPACEWREDASSAVPGAMPADEMPRLRRDDYVHNANDSYWLSNPNELLEGYSPIIGRENAAVTLRTRAGFHFIAEALENGGKVNARTLQDMLFSHRNFGAELLMDDAMQICAGEVAPVTINDTQVDINTACDVLAGWDRRGAIDSRGAHVWREFWRDAQRIPDLYTVPFDNADPVNTPRGIDVANAQVKEALRTALAQAQVRLQTNGLALDATLGEVQFENRNGVHIPIPGGEGWTGMWSVITTQMQPQQGYTPILHGNSYMQVISWEEDGRVDPQAILSYSQSEDPASPHFADQTELYSQGEWLQLPFYEEDILADPNLITLTLRE